MVTCFVNNSSLGYTIPTIMRPSFQDKDFFSKTEHMCLMLFPTKPQNVLVKIDSEIN